MRIALALLVVAACGKSSAPEDRSRADRGENTGGSPTPVGTPDPGSVEAGSGATPAQPAPETKLGSASNTVMEQQARIALGQASETPPTDLPPDPGADKGPQGKITVASKTSFDKTNLSADAVADQIVREHLAALGACYRGTLARDASVKGNATLALTVKPDGKVASAKATAPNAALQACFGKAMQTWTFPVPKNADGEPAEAGFQIALELAPE